jgi:hypothetical protein
MEKPEWFEAVDALDSAPESVAPSSVSARTARFAKSLAAIGAAVLIAGGGIALAQSNFGLAANQALSSTSSSSTGASTSSATPTSSTQAQSAPAATSAAVTAQPSLTGGRPSITGGPSGDGGND